MTTALPYDLRTEIDLFYHFSGKNNPNLLLIGGVHGVEHPISSVLLKSFCIKFASKLNKFNVYIVYCLNPSGAILMHRENFLSVDLNRNYRNRFEDNNSYYKIGLPQFGRFSGIFSSSLNMAWCLVSALKFFDAEKFSCEITKGQCEFPSDPYYAGKKYQAETVYLINLLNNIKEQSSERTFYFDIHTGYGEYSKMSVLHLFPKGSIRKSFIDTVWVNETVTSEGDTVTIADDVFEDRLAFAGTLEFGTYSPLTIFWGVVVDNARFNKSFESSIFQSAWRRFYSCLFFPSSMQWRRNCEREFSKFFQSFFEKS